MANCIVVPCKPWYGFDWFSSSDFTTEFLSSANSTQLKLNDNYRITNKAVLDKLSESNGTLLYDGNPIGGDSGSSSSLDFTSLSAALTGGTQTGITITADTTDNTFDFIVSGIPTVTINENDEWVIDGVSTGRSSKGANGTTPTIDSVTKHWLIGETDTNVVAEGQSGFSPTVSFTDITGGRTMSVVTENGTVTTDIMDGADGVTTVSTNGISFTCTFLASGWQNDTAPYAQTVSINGLTASLNPIIDVVISNDVTIGLEEEKQWSYVTRGVTAADSLTLYCYKTKPTIDLNVILQVN